MTPLLLIAGIAHAGIVAEIGPPVETRTGGTWARALPTDTGWRMGVGTNGDFFIGDLYQTGTGLDGWDFDRSNWAQVTDHGDLKDHNVQMCDGGGYMVVSSANLVDHNDSAYHWFSNDNLDITAWGPVEEEVSNRAHNDMAALCTPWATGAAFGGYGDGREPAYFFELDRGGGVSGEVPLGNKFVMGGGLLADAPTDRIILTTANIDGILHVTSYTPDWEELDELELDLAGAGQRTYWPSSLIRVGQYYVLAMMSAEDLPAGSGDTGNVHLYVFTEDFDLVEEHRITDQPSGRDGAMRPWVAHKDDLLIVSYDVQNNHMFNAIRLDLSGVDEVDTGFDEDDGDGDGDGDDTPEDAAEATDTDKGGCSAIGASSGLVGGLLAMGLVGVRRREQPTG